MRLACWRTRPSDRKLSLDALLIDVALRNCFGATPKPTRDGCNYSELVLPACDAGNSVGDDDPGAAVSLTAATGCATRKSRFRSSSTFGNSSRLRRPKWSRKNCVVSYRSGRPGTSARPAIFTNPRSIRVCNTPSMFTPRTASTSARVIGWR